MTGLYDYSFAVWPDETAPCNKGKDALYELFRYLNHRIVVTYAERAFNDFREELAQCGLTLRGVERAPHLESESVP